MADQATAIRQECTAASKVGFGIRTTDAFRRYQVECLFDERVEEVCLYSMWLWHFNPALADRLAS